MKTIILTLVTYGLMATDAQVAIIENEVVVQELRRSIGNEKEVSEFHKSINKLEKAKFDALETNRKENGQESTYDIERKYDEMIIKCWTEIDAYTSAKVRRHLLANYKDKYIMILERRGLQTYQMTIPLIDITGVVITDMSSEKELTLK